MNFSKLTSIRLVLAIIFITCCVSAMAEQVGRPLIPALDKLSADKLKAPATGEASNQNISTATPILPNELNYYWQDFVKGLRVKNVTDHLNMKGILVNGSSGQVRFQTDFTSPLNGAIRYQTPLFKYSGPVAAIATTPFSAATAINQSGNATGLLVESLGYFDSNGFTMFVRSVDVSNNKVLWSKRYSSTPKFQLDIYDSRIIDVNDDGTDEILIAGWDMVKMMSYYTVLNSVTGDVMSTYYFVLPNA